jgi:hypothetical protein
MMHITQNRCVYGPYPSSGILNNQKTRHFGKINLFPFAGEEGGETLHFGHSEILIIRQPI